MDSRTSAIRDEAFASTGRLGEACVSKHLTSVTPSDGVVTHPSKDQIWIAMEWAGLGGD
jgi:hypothetical protein